VQRLALIIDQARAILPASIAESLPSDADDVKAFVVANLRSHAEALRAAGTHFGLGLVQVLIGFVIGALVSLTRARPRHYDRPLARALVERARRLNHAFRSIVFAQIRISAVNSILTALFLLVGLRLFGVRLPLAKTLVVLTFIVGLIPVLGNLISNTVIVVVAASVSLGAAIACLAFLVVIHKLEYFLNARIVGAEIRAAAWELLIAMLVMEAAFGIAGIVAAPIYYAWLKDELKARALI
jgi:predicted PurR-regulated permease PerM